MADEDTSGPESVPDDEPSKAETGTSRRSFLSAAGLTTAGVAGANLLSPEAAHATPYDRKDPPDRRDPWWRPDEDSLRFTVVVMPDTQYLFDDKSIHPAPLAESLEYVVGRNPDENIVALAHLGDITQNGLPHEFSSAGNAFGLLDRHGVTYSVLAGNHDVDAGTDDQRGTTPYLRAFGPSRFTRAPGYLHDTGGYNSARKFRAGGRDWLLLALDWRPSDEGIAWARGVIAGSPRTPVILTVHDLVYHSDAAGHAVLSDNGQRLWKELIADHDQVFLALGGHYWPPGRVTRTNEYDRDVHMHITNYQDRYYGGAAMIRLYRFDLERPASIHTHPPRSAAPVTSASPSGRCHRPAS